jgi:hypothetical protein
LRFGAAILEFDILFAVQLPIDVSTFGEVALMKWFRLCGLSTFAVALLCGAAQYAAAGVIYVTDSLGNVWQYNGISHMSTQTQTSNTGILVRDATVAGNNYKDDQDATCDLSTGIVYRINAAGDIISYLDVANYLANTAPITVATGIYTANKAINGASYDGNTNGFYTVSPAGTTNPGDIAKYSTIALFLLGTPDSVATAGFNGNVLNFYDPDTTPGTTVPAGGSVMINAQYYQVPGGGGLEGFASIAAYAATANNRVNFTGANAFGGTTPTYQARAAFAVPVPEPASVVLCGIAVSWILAFRRR